MTWLKVTPIFWKWFNRPLQEGRCGFNLLVRQHLDVRQSSVVVDADMHPFPTGASAVHSAIVGDCMAGLVKFGQFFLFRGATGRLVQRVRSDAPDPWDRIA